MLFLERMERVEHEMEGLATAVSARRRGLSGSVSLGVGQFWLGHILPEVVARMASTYSGVQIRIPHRSAGEDLMQRLKLSEIDFLLARIVDELPEGVAGEPLAEVRMHPLARQGHPLAGAGQVRVGTLAEYGVLPPQSDPTIRHGFIDAGLEPPLPRVETVSRNVTFGLLEASDMVTVTPTSPSPRRPRAWSVLRPIG